MAVLKLAAYRCRETISILKVLLDLALSGKLRGVMVCYRTDDGEEETVLTGAYKVNPNRAAGASLRMSFRLMRAHGEID